MQTIFIFFSYLQSPTRPLYNVYKSTSWKTLENVFIAFLSFSADDFGESSVCRGGSFDDRFLRIWSLCRKFLTRIIPEECEQKECAFEQSKSERLNHRMWIIGCESGPCDSQASSNARWFMSENCLFLGSLSMNLITRRSIKQCWEIFLAFGGSPDTCCILPSVGLRSGIQSLDTMNGHLSFQPVTFGCGHVWKCISKCISNNEVPHGILRYPDVVRCVMAEWSNAENTKHGFYEVYKAYKSSSLRTQHLAYNGIWPSLIILRGHRIMSAGSPPTLGSGRMMSQISDDMLLICMFLF